MTQDDHIDHADHFDRASAMARAAKLDTIEAEIRARAPRPEARERVSCTTAPALSDFQSIVRIAGARDDVLDFAATLYAEVKGMVRPDGTLPLAVSAIESESSEHLQLILSRNLYET